MIGQTRGKKRPPNTPYDCAEARRTQVADATFRDWILHGHVQETVSLVGAFLDFFDTHRFPNCDCCFRFMNIFHIEA